MIAVCPGTFDPVTHGHMDIISRASHLFEHVIVGVAFGIHKKPLFDVKQRVEMLRVVLEEFGNVTVEPFEGLTFSFAKERRACLLRGLRAVSDFDYEFRLAGMNQSMGEGVETVFLPASANASFVSSTMVREVYCLGGDVRPFVDERVLALMDVYYGA